MTDYEKIERYVSDLLTLSGMDMEGKSATGTLLFHAYVAVAMFEQMDAEERALVKGMQRRMKYFFSSNFNLKERKRKTEKQPQTRDYYSLFIIDRVLPYAEGALNEI